MEHTVIDSQLLRDMFTNGYKELFNQKDYVNDLNVFPVPDGDTGLNMSRTLQGGVDALIDAPTVGGCLKAFARGTLMSARGNSGVILSQFFRGFVKDTEDLDVFTIDSFIDAIANGREQAYSSVVNPTEGTMLTLMSDAVVALNEARSSIKTFEELFNCLISTLEWSLQRTPSLLAVLAEANVVDSGGAGLLAIFKGMAMAIDGTILENIVVPAAENSDTAAPLSLLDEDGEIVFGYCTEFILQLFNSKTDVSAFNVDAFIEDLKTFGDSIVAVQDEVLVKVHIHTNTPEVVLTYAHKYGEFLTLKIENMTVQHNELGDNAPGAGASASHGTSVTAAASAEEELEHTEFGVIAVASGDGISDFFKMLGVKIIIDGGQTNNPSAEEFTKAIERVNADHIVLLPNNSNIILTANQAKSICSDKDIRVIETKSIAEGYSCLSMMDLYVSTVNELIDSMTASLDNVVTGLITTATRDTNMDGVEITKGNFIGLANKTIYSCCESRVDCAYNLIKGIPEIGMKEVLTIFQGKNVTEDELMELQDKVSADYPLMEIGIIPGGQDVYDYIMAIE